MSNLKKIFFLLTTLLILAVPTWAYDGKSEDLMVNGSATGEFQADTAIVSFIITGTAEDPEEATRLSNLKERAIHQALEQQTTDLGGFDQANYTLRPIYNDKGKIINYIASRHVKFSVNDPAKAGLFIDLLLSAGVDKITDVNFVVNNQKELARQLLKDAVLDARDKAEIAATTCNRKLGRLLHLNIFNAPSGENRMYYAKTAAADSVETFIEPTAVKIRVQVDATFALE